tara:strand:- start:251 stop:508 length:258 start_codon:yes stop_codon:yes gene_type:complete
LPSIISYPKAIAIATGSAASTAGVKVNTLLDELYANAPPPLADAVLTDRLDPSNLSVFKLVKLASTSVLVRGDPFPDLVTIVAII